ncbi:MAG: polyprenyl synthetase family protein [Opitutaceae bacterium]|nr:polyprenyl synthetase family protein [Opitutaceae bacterium]
MAELDRFLRNQIAAFEPEVREMANYCIDTTGKRIRPALVFFSGWREPAAVSPDLVRIAAVVELVHLATLVHDDMMDEAELRRGRRTAARAFGPVAAVLLGDALFSHALHLASQFPTTEVCLAISDSTRKVCAGEIIQTLRRGSVDVSLADYRRVIDLKTAELFQVSCVLGSRLAGCAADYVDAAGRFGRRLGIAYQIYDDLADYFGEEKRIGKTLGTDFASGKLTLPLLTLLERVSGNERAALLEEIQGRRPSQLELHLSQMAAHGVFPVVAAAVQAEIAAASAVLAPWPNLAPTRLLLGLCDVLRRRVEALQAPS